MTAETFGRPAGEHVERFGSAWDDDDAGGLGESERSKFFGDGPTAVDLRRMGLSPAVLVALGACDGVIPQRRVCADIERGVITLR